MTNKQPTPRTWSTRVLIRRADDYRKLSGMFDEDRSNYHRFYCRCVGELISRGLWEWYEERVKKRRR
jgi:hypothetical protein